MINEKQRIDKRLKEDYEFLIREYGKNSVFAVLLFGSQNYTPNYLDPESDIDTYGVVIPSLVDIAFMEDTKIKRVEREEGILVVMSLAHYVKQLVKGSSNYLETLVSPFTLVNEQYKTDFEEFVNYRDDIVKNNFDMTIMAGVGMQHSSVKGMIKALDAGDLRKAQKHGANAYRLALFIRGLLTGRGLENSIQMFELEELTAFLNLKRKKEYSPEVLIELSKNLKKTADESARMLQDIPKAERDSTAFKTFQKTMKQKVANIYKKSWDSLVKKVEKKRDIVFRSMGRGKWSKLPFIDFEEEKILNEIGYTGKPQSYDNQEFDTIVGLLDFLAEKCGYGVKCLWKRQDSGDFTDELAIEFWKN